MADGTATQFDRWAQAIQASAPDLELEDIRSVWEGKAVRLQLGTPVEFAGKDYTELTLQPLTARHMRELPLGFGAAGVGSLGDLFTLAAKQAGVPDAVLDKLRPADLRKLTNLASAFFALSQGTGAP